MPTYVYIDCLMWDCLLHTEEGGGGIDPLSGPPMGVVGSAIVICPPPVFEKWKPDLHIATLGRRHTQMMQRTGRVGMGGRKSKHTQGRSMGKRG